MADLKPTLTLTGTQAHLGATLSLSVEDTLSVASPMRGVSIVAAANSSGGITNILAASAGNKYFYIKHTTKQADGSTTAGGDIIISIAGEDHIRIASGEFAFFPIKANLTIGIQSNDGDTINVEYAYFTKA